MNRISTSLDAPTVLETLRREGLERQPADGPDRLARYTVEEVRRHLARPIAPFSRERLEAFLSPAADGLLESLAQAAHAVTRQRHGRVVYLYAPLYLSNVCVNQCRYCGFGARQDAGRRRLSVEEAVAEAEIIAGEGFRDLLLVSGEDPEHVTPAYLEAVAARLRKRFATVSVEIHGQPETVYRRLFDAGVDGVTLYQETYDRDVYARWHPSGPKASYEDRFAAQEAAARAGMRRLGLGALLGLADWRYETLCLGLHARVMMKRFWRSRIAFSFPRIRPAPHVDVDAVPHLVDDRALARMMVALRLCFPDAGLVLSTREPAPLRERLLPLGVTRMSAGSKTSPGGYRGDGATAQFDVGDTRPVREVVESLRAAGYDPVWKDWDEGFLGPAAPAGIDASVSHACRQAGTEQGTNPSGI